jgi:hypothetical protein
VTDGVGVFIRRTNPGFGNVSATVTLNMQSLPAGTLNFKVFGIEMVHIPSGNFALNDSTTGGNRFLNYNVTNASVPAGALYAGSLALGANYPTGFAGFYAAKKRNLQRAGGRFSELPHLGSAGQSDRHRAKCRCGQ